MEGLQYNKKYLPGSILQMIKKGKRFTTVTTGITLLVLDRVQGEHAFAEEEWIVLILRDSLSPWVTERDRSALETKPVVFLHVLKNAHRFTND